MSVEAFAAAPGYLNAATMGLPPLAARRALTDALDDWQRGASQAADYDADVQRCRQLFARLVDVPSSRVAIGSQASVTAGLVGASLPDGASVVCVAGDFTSIIFPFLVHADRGVTVRHVPGHQLAAELRAGDDLVVFSSAQSADGTTIDVHGVVDAARAVGALTFCDTTQAVGWLESPAADLDVTVCAAYKWLCCPRGVAFSTFSDRALRSVRPVNAGWYAGESVWDSCYGPDMRLADDARRFDVSPAWLTWVGAVPALQLIADLDPIQRRHGARLADRLRDGLGLQRESRPVLALADADGTRARALTAAGCTIAARAGRVRIAFHLWNTQADVDLALGVLADAPRP